MIDIIQRNPHYCLKIWKTQLIMNLAYGLPIGIGGFMVFVGLVLMSEGRDAELAPLFLIAGVVLVLSHFLFRVAGKEKLCIAIDRKADRLIIHKSSKGIVSRLSGASQIRQFRLITGGPVRSKLYKIGFIDSDDPADIKFTGLTLFTLGSARKAVKAGNRLIKRRGEFSTKEIKN